MVLERGFRRIVIALSVLLLVLGMLEVRSNINYRATVQVTLKDGRKFAIGRHGSKDDLTDRDSLADALKNGYARQADPQGLRSRHPQIGVSAEAAASIVNVEYLRGPEYWWWTDSGAMKVAAGLVLVLWIASTRYVGSRAASLDHRHDLGRLHRIVEHWHQQPPALRLQPRQILVPVATPVHHEERLEGLPAIGEEMLVPESEVRIRQTALRARARRHALAVFIEPGRHR
jgi:hypothetical protein